MQTTGARLPIIVLALALGACDAKWKYEQERSERAATTYPPNYKTEILDYMRSYLNDPTRVRDAYVSEPTLRNLDGRSRYSVCIRYNARNAEGRYLGSRDSLVTFRDGRLDHLIDSRLDRGAGPDPAREQCRDAAYQRFPELERLTR